MNLSHCEREKEIVQALRRGSLDAELEKHLSDCAICSDAAAVSRFLQAEILQTDEQCAHLPGADFLWWKGHLAAKQAAVERATRSIALVRRITYLAITAAAVWLLFAPGHLDSMMSVLSKHEMWPTGGLGASALLMGIGAGIFTVLGSLYLARAEK